MLKEASFPGLLKKAQVQGGAPHCGMWIAEWAGRRGLGIPQSAMGRWAFFSSLPRRTV